MITPNPRHKQSQDKGCLNPNFGRVRQCLLQEVILRIDRTCTHLRGRLFQDWEMLLQNRQCLYKSGVTLSPDWGYNNTNLLGSSGIGTSSARFEEAIPEKRGICLHKTSPRSNMSSKPSSNSCAYSSTTA